MAGVPYTFANATTAIPLSELDVCFATPVTIGNTTVALGNTVTTIGGLDTQSPLDDSGNVATTAYVDHAASMTLLNTMTANNSASLSDTTSITSAYSKYLIIGTNIVPTANAVTLGCNFSTDGGANYDTGSNYTYTGHYSTGATGADIGTTTTRIPFSLGAALSNSGGAGGICFELMLYAPSDATTFKKLSYEQQYVSSTGAFYSETAGGYYIGSTAAVNAIRFQTNSANIAFGVFTVYGIK